MKASTYLPYFDYNDSKFDIQGSTVNGQDYADMLEKEYNRSKGAVDCFMNGKESPATALKSEDGQTYHFGQNIAQNEPKMLYSKSSAIILDADDKDETVDTLIEHFARQEMFISKLEFMEDMEEDFEIELTLWKNEHNKLNSYKTKGYKFITDRNGNREPIDEWILKNEPVRNVRISFLNKANTMIFAELKKCKIIDIEKNNKIDLLVESIDLIDKFVN